MKLTEYHGSFSQFPPYDSNDRFLSLCKSLIVLENDTPPGL